MSKAKQIFQQSFQMVKSCFKSLPSHFEIVLNLLPILKLFEILLLHNSSFTLQCISHHCSIERFAINFSEHSIISAIYLQSEETESHEGLLSFFNFLFLISNFVFILFMVQQGGV